VVNIDQLSQEELKLIKDYLLNAAIEMDVKILETDYNEDRTSIIYNIPNNDLKKSEIELNEYSVSIKKNKKHFNIKYNIIIMN
jgi:hypothetical protein